MSLDSEEKIIEDIAYIEEQLKNISLKDIPHIKEQLDEVIKNQRVINQSLIMIGLIVVGIAIALYKASS